MDSAPKFWEPPKQDPETSKPLRPVSGTISQIPASSSGSPDAIIPASNRSIWAHRVWLVIFVVFCIELGMFLAVLPWTSVWNQNSFLVGYPRLREFTQQNFMRGLFTGVGLVDIWIGIWEAVHYRDPRG